ncbi:MAG: glutamate 5-kinase [Candidatus Hydrogenedentes bacterium]|nr:glutamate 5-kinase [Candidatus Hydrogenedentota bacterium]
MSTIPNNVRTLVVKVGTSLLAGPSGFDGLVLESIVKELAALKRERDLNVLMVSSGAIGCGMNLLGMTERPKVLPLKQATAAVGQSRLMHYYEVMFDTYGEGLHTAQVLLSAADLDDRQRYINIRNTIHTLFELKTIIPIANENDSVATEELRFGDNDTLAARLAGKVDADLLILLSDVDGLFDKNPTTHKDAALIEHVETVTDETEALAGDTRMETSVGGMKTKLEAAKIACASGLVMVIANGRRPNIVRDVLDGNAPCTTFGKSAAVLSHRKRWIAFGRSTRGAVRIDDGARRALLEQGRSLLAAGITSVDGSFDMGAAVRILDATGKDVARGLVNYSSDDINLIKGCKSASIQSILGRKDFDEVIHRDNLVLL